MGGNIFSTQRISRAEWEQAISDITKKFPKNTFFYQKVVDEKESFGDVDLYTTGSINAEEVANKLSNGAVVCNDGTYSFLYNNIQVDVKALRDLRAGEGATNEWNHFMLDFGDLFGLCGKLASYIHLKLRNSGLFLKIWISPEKPPKLIFLTQDVKHVLDFLGLSYKDYRRGFKTHDSIVEWLSASPYFSSRAFSKDVGNSHARKRDAKREMSKSIMSKLSSMESSPRPKLSEIIYKALQFQITLELLELFEDLNDSVVYKRLFSKNALKSMFGLEGLDLHDYKQLYFKTYAKEDLPGRTYQDILKSMHSIKEEFDAKRNAVSK